MRVIVRMSEIVRVCVCVGEGNSEGVGESESDSKGVGEGEDGGMNVWDRGEHRRATPNFV